MTGNEDMENSVKKAVGLTKNVPSNKVFKVTELTGCFMRPIIERTTGITFKPNEAMMQGTMFHAFIPKIIGSNKKFKNPQYEVEGEMDCSDEFGDFKIIGHCDVLLPNKVLEFKYSKVDYQVNIGYLLQSNFYCELFDRKSADLIIVDKDDFRVSVKHIKKNKESIELVIYLAKQMRKILLGKEKVDIKLYENSFCNKCQYRKQCENYDKSPVLTETI